MKPDSAGLAEWLLLHHAPGVGPVRFHKLLERFSSPAGVMAAGPSAWRECGLGGDTIDWLRAPDRSGVETDLAWAEDPHSHILTWADPGYPSLLREIAAPPPLLYVRGDPAVLGRPQLAMVGSRNPSPDGRENAFEFARSLATAGLCITSGLAIGIDSAAHRGALAVSGATIAVAGTGLDRVYPASNRDLAHSIAGSGALVSEFPIGSGVRRANFPRRNRLISGLSLGTLVVEATLRSGSLITARTAMEQGREVFAIPGSIHNPLARGCHRLLRDGAKLVEMAEDVIEELGPLAATLDRGADRAWPGQAGAEPEVAAEDTDYRQLLDAIGFDPVTVDTLVERSGLTPEAVSSMLLILELKGSISALLGGLFSRAGKRS